MDKDITKTQPYRLRWKQMLADTTQWRSLWKDVVDYVLPTKGRYLHDDSHNINDGTKRHQKIINGTAGQGLRILAAGMQGGMTSPTRPWFALGVDNKDLMENQRVRAWLHHVTDTLLSLFARSNFYDTVHGSYMELAGFGTDCIMIESDPNTVVRFRLLTIGEYCLALDARYRPASLYRQFAMTALQMEEEFGKEHMSSDAVTALETSGQKDKKFEILHCIQPNNNLDLSKGDMRGMEYESVYFELNNNDGNKFLRKGGYHGKPFAATRWDFAGVDVYGTCPIVNTLGDVKMLQIMENKKLKKIDKNVDPPMNAPTVMRDIGGTIVAGGVNYYDASQGAQQFIPAYHPSADITSVVMEIQNVEQRIKMHLYNDLFMILMNSTTRRTAEEIREISGERLLLLGPVLERQQTEKLEVIIERTYDLAERSGYIAEPPMELQGQALKVEYIGTLAQAQKAVGSVPIEQTAAFVGNLAGIFPEVVDKFDADQAVDLYAINVGVPPDVVRSDDDVEKIRAERARVQQMQQVAANAMAAVQGAKTLSETPMDADSALNRVMQGVVG